MQLLGEAVSRYRSIGRKQLRLRVSDPNINAIKFSYSWGFRPVDTEPDSFGETYIMVRDL